MKKVVLDSPGSLRRAARRKRGTSRLFVLGAAFMASAAAGGLVAPPAYAAETAQQATRGERLAGRSSRTGIKTSSKTSRGVASLLSLRQAPAQAPGSRDVARIRASPDSISPPGR